MDIGTLFLLWPGLVVLLCHLHPDGVRQLRWLWWPMALWATVTIIGTFAAIAAAFEAEVNPDAAEATLGAVLAFLCVPTGGLLALYWCLFQYHEEGSIPLGVELWTVSQPHDPAEAVRRHAENKANMDESLIAKRSKHWAEAERLKMEQEMAEMQADIELREKLEEYEEAKKHLDAMKKQGRRQK